MRKMVRTNLLPGKPGVIPDEPAVRGFALRKEGGPDDPFGTLGDGASAATSKRGGRPARTHRVHENATAFKFARRHLCIGIERCLGNAIGGSRFAAHVA